MCSSFLSFHLCKSTSMCLYVCIQRDTKWTESETLVRVLQKRASPNRAAQNWHVILLFLDNLCCLFIYVYIFIVCCFLKNVSVVHVVYFVPACSQYIVFLNMFLCFLLFTLFLLHQYLILFVFFMYLRSSVKCLSNSSRSGGKAQILCCKLFFQWFLQSRLEVDPWQTESSIFVHIYI